MVIASDLLKRYNEILAGPVNSDSCLSGECVSMLCETSWIKMMVIRYQMAPEISSIEIEISLPSCAIEIAFPPNSDVQEEAHKYIQNAVCHLEYLLKLQKAGFSLGILSTEGIWSAVLKIKGVPSPELFETLIPPN